MIILWVKEKERRERERERENPYNNNLAISPTLALPI